ncbi:MAG: YbgC/FadM family acyl-CoA thioesterase [Bauldia sp.]|nr:YbgC/FadM family acyl-CoA thioesterase [Bauldia sp.]
MADNDWPDLAGHLSDGVHRLPVRIYYEDTDFSGAVYHASYVRILERGRTDFLRVVGIGHRELAAAGLNFALHRLDVTFHRPAAIDDVVIVETTPGEVTAARALVGQRILHGETVLVEAAVTVVLVSPDGRARRFPPAIRDTLLARRKPVG